MLGIRFFQPDDTLLESIVKYANGRIIFDVGFGSGDLMIELKNKGARVTGIELFQEMDTFQKLLENGIGSVLWGDVKRHEKLINCLGDKALLLFARPCHSDFVEFCLDVKDPKTEALYITVPENLNLYDDLGDYRDKAKRIILEGTSLDNEIIMSIC